MSPAQVGNLNAGEHHVLVCPLVRRSARRAGGPRRPELRRPGPHALGRPTGHAHQTVPDSTLRWTAKGTWDPLPGFDQGEPDPRDVTVLDAPTSALCR